MLRIPLVAGARSASSIKEMLCVDIIWSTEKRRRKPIPTSTNIPGDSTAKSARAFERMATCIGEAC